MNKGVKEMILVRKIRGLTQDDVAKATKINRSTIASIEAGINNPSKETILKLKAFFGIPIEYFFEEVE